MAIAPPSDIVLDVANAVDPVQYRAAVDKLARIAKSGGAATGEFDSLLGSLDASAPEESAPVATPFIADLRGRLPPTKTASVEAADKPYRQFEAFVLQTFIQSMLPKDASHVFGDGLAGSYWSSMLAEQIADQLSKAGGIGIAAAIKPHTAGSALSSLPGMTTSLELGFANSVRPSPGDVGIDDDDDLMPTDET